MAGVNKVILIGNLGADPETNITPTGTSVARMRLAVSETWKDGNGQRQEHTEWINLVAWRSLADLASRFLRKGAKIYVEGKLQNRSWDDKATGQKRYATEVFVDELTFLDGAPRRAGEGNPGEDGSQAPRPRRRSAEAGRTEVEDDLPF